MPAGLPQNGSDPAELLRDAARILIDHSTFTSHPQFFGYINGSVAPIGALSVLIHVLLDHAISASPPGSTRL